MSLSPLDAAGAADPYLAAWQAVNSLMRRGFSWSGGEPNRAFLNVEGGRFADVSSASGLDFVDDARAAVAIDWNFDGNLDLWVANRTGPRLRLMQSELPPTEDFVALRLVGVECNRDAIGARAELFLEGGSPRRHVRARRAGEGFLAQAGAWLHFGLGGGVPERALVRWPGGAPESFAGLRRGGRYVLVQGSGVAQEWTPPEVASALHAEPFEPPRPSSVARVVLPVRVPLPGLPLVREDGRKERILGMDAAGHTGLGHPLLVNAWATWCQPCAAELAALARRTGELADQGLELLALNVEDPEERAESGRFLDRLGWSAGRAVATPETLAILDALQGALMDRETPAPLPASFLVDARGRLAAVYFGPVDADTLLADLALLELDLTSLRDAAIPFPGRWRSAPAELDHAYFATRYERRGLTRAARELELAAVSLARVSPAEMLYQMGAEQARAGRLDLALQSFAGALRQDPRHVQAQRALAVAHHVRGELPAAILAYELALELDPKDAGTWHNLGLAQLAAGNRRAALRVLDALRPLDESLADGLARNIEARDAEREERR